MLSLKQNKNTTRKFRTQLQHKCKTYQNNESKKLNKSKKKLQKTRTKISPTAIFVYVNKEKQTNNKFQKIKTKEKTEQTTNTHKIHELPNKSPKKTKT